MGGSVQEISDAIRSIVASGGQLPGSRLSAALKVRLPQWNPADFGARSLREFVADNVKGVVVVGRAGMDVLYGLEGAEATSSPDVATLPVSQPDFWRIWVSPNSPFALVVDRTNATPHAVPRGASAAEGQVLLEPPSVEVHRSVARKFLTTVTDEARVRLQGILDQSIETWWRSWLRELRGSPLLASWNAFRCDEFENRLRSQLHAASMSEASIDRVLAVIRERRIEAPQRLRRWTQQMSAERTDGEDLRRVVLEAVRRMSVAELRDLRLPLGIVFDVVASSKSR